MDRTPPPVTLAAARALPITPGRSAEVFVDGGRPTNGPQTPHLRDEIYVVTSGTARYRVEDKVTDVGPGDPLFCVLRRPHAARVRGQLGGFHGVGDVLRGAEVGNRLRRGDCAERLRDRLSD